MRSWDVRQISEKEYHVIETRYVGEPEFILARCSGPVPAWDIVYAMRISQRLQTNKDSIHNSIFGIQGALSNFEYEINEAKKGQAG